MHHAAALDTMVVWVVTGKYLIRYSWILFVDLCASTCYTKVLLWGSLSLVCGWLKTGSFTIANWHFIFSSVLFWCFNSSWNETYYTYFICITSTLILRKNSKESVTVPITYYSKENNPRKTSSVEECLNSQQSLSAIIDIIFVIILHSVAKWFCLNSLLRLTCKEHKIQGLSWHL
jgi:hypothetical protein